MIRQRISLDCYVLEQAFYVYPLNVYKLPFNKDIGKVIYQLLAELQRYEVDVNDTPESTP